MRWLQYRHQCQYQYQLHAMRCDELHCKVRAMYGQCTHHDLPVGAPRNWDHGSGIWLYLALSRCRCPRMTQWRWYLCWCWLYFVWHCRGSSCSSRSQTVSVLSHVAEPFRPQEGSVVPTGRGTGRGGGKGRGRGKGRVRGKGRGRGRVRGQGRGRGRGKVTR